MKVKAKPLPDGAGTLAGAVKATDPATPVDSPATQDTSPDEGFFSSPCLLGEQDPDINPDYFGLQEKHSMEILASNTILYCKHWKESVAFYQHVMNFEISFAKDDWFIEFRVNAGCHLSLADESRCTISSSSGQGITLSFLVANLAGIHRNFEALGVKPTAITSHSWRAPYFYVFDPEGNRIEIWSDSV